MAMEHEGSELPSQTSTDHDSLPCSEKNVLNAIADLKNEKVRDLGLMLDIDEPHLNDIESRDIEYRKSELVKIWFRHSEEAPTWDVLIDALMCPCMKEHHIIRKINRFFLRRNSSSSNDRPKSPLTPVCLQPEHGDTAMETTFMAPAIQPIATTESNDSPMEQTTVSKEEVSQVRTDNKNKIKRSWHTLLKRVRVKLELKLLKNKDAKLLRDTLIEFDDRCVCIPNTSTLNVSGIFRSVTSGRLWSFDNNGLLQNIVDDEEFGDEKMKKQFDDFKSEYNGYLVAHAIFGKLPRYIREEEVSSDEDEGGSDATVTMVRRLTIKLRITSRLRPKINKVTLKYIQDLWNEISKHFHIPSLTALIESIVKGCVKITWLIAPSWACRLIEMVQESESFFQHHGITKVEVNSVCIYEESGLVSDPKEVDSLWLLLACKSGKVKELERLINQQEISTEPDLTPEVDCSPLLVATDFNHSEVVNKLLESVVDKDALPMSSAILLAAKKGHIETFQVLLHHGSDPATTTEEGKTVLMLSAEAGHEEIVKCILNCDESKSDLDLANVQDQAGKTALMLALEGGYYKIAEHLLRTDRFHLDMDVQDCSGMTALMIAVQRQLPEIVHIMITDHNVKVDLTNQDRETALILAAESGQGVCVNALLEKNADIDFIQESTGWTPLFFAAEKGHSGVVKLLTGSEKRAPYACNVMIKDKNGKTALNIADINNHKEVTDVLKKVLPLPQRLFEAAKSSFDRFKKSPLIINPVLTNSEKLLEACKAKRVNLSAVQEYLNQEDIDVNIREDDKFRWTPLMWACENGHTEIGKLLLKHQPNVNVQDSKLWSALILASRGGDLEMVQGLLDQGAEINVQTRKNWTPLMWAAQEGRTEVAKLLLERGARVDDPDENGWTPLMQASQEGHRDVVNVLLDHNANINHQSTSTWCAVMAASKNNHNDVLETLLSRGADVDISRSDGSTALEVASFYKDHSEVMRTIIKHGANVDHQNKDGMTPLMLAINKGHLDLVQTLVHGKVDLNKAHPETGWTAIFFAAKSGNLEIFRELLKGGAVTEIEGMKVTDVASLFKRGKILSELKKFEQVASAHTQLSSHVPTLEPAQIQPTPVELETSFFETKVVASPGDSQPIEPGVIEPTEPAVIKEMGAEKESASVSTTLDVLESTAPVVAKDTDKTIDHHQGSVQQPDTTTTPLVQEQDPSITSVEDKSLPSEPQTQPEQEAKQPSHETPKAIKQKESPQTTEKTKEAKKPPMDIKQKAAYLDLIMKAFEWKMKNTNMNPQDYNSANVIRSRHKGIESDEELTHGRERSVQEDYTLLDYDIIDR